MKKAEVIHTDNFLFRAKWEECLFCQGQLQLIKQLNMYAVVCPSCGMMGPPDKDECGAANNYMSFFTSANLKRVVTQITDGRIDRKECDGNCIH